MARPKDSRPNVRIALRIPEADYVRVANAAQRYNMSVQNFIIAAAEENAQRILSAQTTVK